MDDQQEKRLNALAQEDEWYQHLLQQCEEAEKRYRQIVDKLSDEERDSVERYIALCEELEYRRTCLAVTKTR